MPDRKTYLRFGEVPAGERSGIGASPNWIHAMGRRTDAEAGVSAYEVERDHARGIWNVVGCGNHATANELVARATEGRCQAWLVRGTDGEPLLRGVSVVREVGMNEVAFPGAYDPAADRPDEMVLWEDVAASGELRVGRAGLDRAGGDVLAALRDAGMAAGGPVQEALSAAGWEVRAGRRGLSLSPGPGGMFRDPWSPAAAAVVQALAEAGAAGAVSVRSGGHEASYAMSGGRLVVTCREAAPATAPASTLG